MGPIFGQAVANIRSRPLQSALIFATIFVSTGLLALGAIARNSADQSWLELHRQIGAPHLWVEFDADHVDPDEARIALSSVDGVAAVGPVQRSVELRALGIEGLFSEVEVREWVTEGGLGAARLVDGRPPRAGEAAEIVLDRNVAVTEGFEVGDVFEIPVSSTQRLELEVVGLAVTAENCPHPVCNPTFVHTAPGSLAALGIDPPASPDALDDIVAVRLDDPAAVDRVAAAIDRALPAGGIEDINSWEYIRETTTVATSFQTLLFGGFGIVAMLLSGVLVVNAVAGAVRAQTRNIGLLKAVGFTGRQLAGVYLVEYLGLTAVAGSAAATTAVAVSGPMLRPVTAQFGVASAPVELLEMLIVVLAVLGLVTIFTALPVRKVARVDTVSAIRTGSERPRRRGRRLPRLPVPFAHGLAEVTSRPGRAIVTGSGLLVAVVALVWVVISNATMAAFFEDPELSIYGDSDVLVLRSGLMPEDQAREVIEGHAAVAAVMTEAHKEFSFAGDSERFQARYLDGDVGAFRVPLIEGRLAERDGEAVAGYGIARNEGLEIGDTTQLQIGGQEHRVEITGIVREFNNLGQMLTMPATTLRRLDPDAGANIYLVQLADGVEPEAFAADIESAAGGLLGTASSGSAMPKTLRDLQGVILALSGVNVLVVAVGILSSVSLSVAERRRELGMLKAVGMTPRQVLQSVLVGATMIGAVAVVLGLPLGVGLSRSLSSGITEGIGLGPTDPVVPLAGLALLVPVVVVVTMASAAIPARSAARVEPVAVLRYE